jgi:hypothetical protein
MPFGERKPIHTDTQSSSHSLSLHPSLSIHLSLSLSLINLISLSLSFVNLTYLSLSLPSLSFHLTLTLTYSLSLFHTHTHSLFLSPPFPPDARFAKVNFEDPSAHIIYLSNNSRLGESISALSPVCKPPGLPDFYEYMIPKPEIICQTNTRCNK